jgi:hypothetical protein
MDIKYKLKSLFVFLQYSIGNSCPPYLIRETTQSICEYISQLKHQPEDYNYFKQYLFKFIFYIRDRFYNGKNRPNESFEILLTAFNFYPTEIVNLIELYIYYGSFKDLNNLILLTSDRYDYIPITSKCYDLYVKYILIDYNKSYYFIENDSASVYISRCAEFIPKENKYIDKYTNATHEITKRIFPSLYKRHKHKALKQFRKIYQTNLKLLKISDKHIKNENNIWYPLEFTLLYSGCIFTRSLANLINIHNTKIKTNQKLYTHFRQAYHSYLLNYFTQTINNSYIPLGSYYSAKKYDSDTVEYIKQYYETNIYYFWCIFDTSLSYDYYNRIDKIIKNI